MRKYLGDIKISENISSYTLFHFTNKLEYLFSIIENGFLLKYNYEKLPKTKVAYICPMICFCDIPLGSVKYHLNWYGNYGIGINRKYCKEIGMTPVLYIHSKSKNVTLSTSKKAIMNLERNPITPYLKQQRGKVRFYDKKTKSPKYKWKTFYDEKEWRFIPRKSKIRILTYKNEDELVDIKRDCNNNRNAGIFLVDLEYIEYIIIDNKKDISTCITFLDELRKKKQFDRDSMLSKILTISQIIHDF